MNKIRMGDFESKEPRPLEIRNVNDLNEHFIIPSFQRGYRWERLQVRQMLEDFQEHFEKKKDEPYYLQPIVVSGNPDGSFDVIDGQQRLTTLLILYQVLAKKRAEYEAKEDKDEDDAEFYEDINPNGCSYTIRYSTRNESEKYLKNIASETYTTENGAVLNVKEEAKQTPDFLYMWHAFDEINKIKKRAIGKIAYVLRNNVKIIWYALPGDVPSRKKFSDLNIGKIGLTNSELVKALFLQTLKGTKEEEFEQQTIVAQWDRIERDLSASGFWKFLTIQSPEAYPTKIDLLFDLIARRPSDRQRDKYYTFRHFVEYIGKNKNKPRKELWNEIFLKYLYLRDWFNDRDIYHRIGYLISTQALGGNELQEIFNYSFDNNVDKEGLKKWLNGKISESLKLDSLGLSDYGDLKYNASSNPDTSMDNSHHPMIKRVLTLYNILLTENFDNIRYSFEHHNSVSGGWSLEHIHAQNSQVLERQQQWIDWIQVHLDSASKMARKIDSQHQDEMRQLIEAMESMTSPTRTQFVDIQRRYAEFMGKVSGEGNGLYKDELANMALLGRDANSQLNNSTFDVKRRKIMEMMGSHFVPIATERVFAKSIEGNDIDNLYFWSKDDREAYIADIKKKLAPYITMNEDGRE